MYVRVNGKLAKYVVDAILDKENVNLEELLDEEETIQECKALNSRLINFLRDRAQVEQLLQYIVCDTSEDTDGRRAFKFPFIACEIFTCEIDVILRTLVEDEELMNLLFSFLDPSRPHSSLLAGYFSKVVVCLMLRKTKPFMSYIQAHDYILEQLIDSIGVKSIMEVLVRIVGADVHMYPNFNEAMQWLAESNLLEMLVDKLSPKSPPEVHANAAEVIWVISRNAPSPLATKLSSPSLVSRVFDFALEDSEFKSSLVHSLSVIISILDPKRSLSTALVYSIRSQHLYEPHIPVDLKTITVVLSKLDHLLSLLNTSSNERTLPTTYGELRPPLGRHRLKIVEFITVLLGTGHEAAYRALIESGAIQRVIDSFFCEYPFNNALHHHVENVITSCLLSTIMLLLIISLFYFFLQHPTLSASGRNSPRSGNIGHITRIANKLVQLSSRNDQIQSYLQENDEWVDWQRNVLHERNAVENVYRWACGRPSAMQEKMRDSDDDESHDRDYDVAGLANFSNAFRYNIYGNDDVDEVQGSLDHDEDVYFDDESAEVVISSLRLGDDQDRSCLFTNSDWFAFREDRFTEHLSVSARDRTDDADARSGVADGGDGSDDEVVIGDVEEVANHPMESTGGSLGSSLNLVKEISENRFANNEDPGRSENASSSADAVGAFGFEAQQSEDLFDDQQLPDWVGWHQPSDIQVDEPTGDKPHSLNSAYADDDSYPHSDDELPSACAPEFGQMFGKANAATPAFEAEMKPAAGDESEAAPRHQIAGSPIR
ncbi:unnamed protein product [Spirodela intermedia]|uniref:Uncharacterized protein n=1 Tax=Spirodela intermedia TaxID=51605 RepID=A0A7I8IXM1_SPIIN|nr:unnamed protein product [Spirodela intermedia]CAA6662442.1 unnamed protein product [Spirodela intermedia]